METKIWGVRCLQDGIHNRQSSFGDSLQKSFDSDKEVLLAKAIDMFPYLIHIFAPDGTTVFVNEVVRKQYGITREVLQETIIGKYNVLKDPSVTAAIPPSLLQRAFCGETVYCPDIKVPLNPKLLEILA